MSFALGCGNPQEGASGYEADQDERITVYHHPGDNDVEWDDEIRICEMPDDNICIEQDEEGSEFVEKRLHRDPRTAIKLEAFYALSRAHDGGSGVPKLNGMTVSDWNYLASDWNAYRRGVLHLGCCSSLWTSNGACNLGCYGGPFKRMGGNSFYDNVGNYGFFGGRGRGGQCLYFAELVLYRSGVRFQLPGVPERMLPSYTQVRNDFNGRRSFTKPASQARPGDVLFTKTSNGHVAVVVRVLEGREGHSATGIDVVDSNYVTWGGADEEIIARHPIRRGGSGTANLDNYVAVDVTLHLRE